MDGLPERATSPKLAYHQYLCFYDRGHAPVPTQNATMSQALRKSLSFWKQKNNSSMAPSSPSRQDGHRTGRPSNGQSNLQRTDKDGQLEAAPQVSSLRSIIDRSRAELERLEAENERLHVQQQHDLRNLRQVDQANDETIIALTRYTEFFVSEAQKLKARLAATDSQRPVAKHEVHEPKSQVESLKNDLKHIHTWLVRAQNDQRHLEQIKERVKDLETRNAWLLKNAEAGARDFYQEWTQCVEKEAQVKHLLNEWEKEREKERKSIVKEEHAKMRRLEEDFARKLGEKDAILEQTRTEMSRKREMAENANLTIAGLRRDLAESQQEAQVLRTSQDKAEAKIAELIAAREEHGRILGTGATPRVILALKLMQSNSHPTLLEQGDLAMMQFTQSCSTNLLTPKLLDVSLSTEQALKLARHVADDASLKDSISLVVCVVCKMPKIMSSSHVCEFPSSNGGHMSCCQRAVCISCLCDSIVKSVTSGWWHNLDSSQWLTCPIPGCDKIVPLRHADELPRLLRSGGLKQVEIDDLLSESRRATAFREALAGLTPAPTEEALRIAAKLHARLVATGKMKSLFDPSFENTEPDDDGRLPEFRPGRIKMLGVDVDDVSTQGQPTTVQVPVFTRFFNRKSVECVVCGEMLLDIDYGQNAQEWKDHCTGFPGPWMWDVLLFPAGLVMGCEPYHMPDTCKECLRTHLRVQLEQFGRDHCDRLSCPSANCGRSLNYAEVKAFADNETFEK